VIGDLHGPLNPGELDTVRIVMNVEEAEALLVWLNGQRPTPIVHDGDAYDDLRGILVRSLARAQETPR
jgi:hypothetical protein